jgi:transcriptional regulator with XRE-family HTH domain
MSSLEERITELLKERGLSFETAAHAMDPPTTGKTLAKWANGIEKPQIKNFAALARFFDVNSDYLLGFTDKRSPQPLNDQARELEKLNEARKISGAGERRASGGASPRRRVDSDQ